jgi:hypothetical protein
MDYTMADSMLQGRNRQSRKYANNTFLQRRGDDIVLRLHATDIVTWKACGDVVLDANGWHTVTTKERMNRVLPQFMGIYQEKGRWFVNRRSNNGQTFAWNSETVAVYQDGMVIKADGTIEGAGEYQPKADRAMKKRARDYAKACSEAIPLDMPGAGDCFFCLMKTENGQSLGDATGNVEHLESHMEEEYVVPSLVWQAMVAKHLDPARNIQFQLVFTDDCGNSGNMRSIGVDAVKKSVYTFILRRFGFAVN